MYTKDKMDGVPCGRTFCIHYDASLEGSCNGVLDGGPMLPLCSAYVPAEGKFCKDCEEFIPKGWLHGCYDRVE